MYALVSNLTMHRAPHGGPNVPISRLRRPYPTSIARLARRVDAWAPCPRSLDVVFPLSRCGVSLLDRITNSTNEKGNVVIANSLLYPRRRREHLTVQSHDDALYFLPYRDFRYPRLRRLQATRPHLGISRTNPQTTTVVLT